MTAEYSLAMAEVLCIINQSQESYKRKIPQSFKKFIEENADSTYNPDFDINVPLKELKLRKETKSLLALIYRSYICNDEERIEYDKILKANSEEMQKQLNEKYDVYKVFNSRQSNNMESNQEFDNLPKDLVQYKRENIFNRIINRIKNFFKGRK